MVKISVPRLFTQQLTPENSPKYFPECFEVHKGQVHSTEQIAKQISKMERMSIIKLKILLYNSSIKVSSFKIAKGVQNALMG